MIDLKELIHEKINEVFLEYQKANNIISGDIDPFDAYALENVEETLCELVAQICAKQKKAINFDNLAPSWYIYTDEEGIAHSVTHDNTVDMDRFFYYVSQRIAFDDCSNETVKKIYFRGKEVFYAGWKPGMRFEYEDTNGNIIWVGTFEQWDH